MEYERDEQVVFVKDLLFAALYKWRQIVVVAIVLALVLGGFSLLSQQKTSTAEAESNEEQRKLCIRNIENLEIQIESQTAYLTQSPIMDMDPYGVYKASLELMVQTDYQILPGMNYQNPDYTGAILNAYTVYLSSDQVLQSMAQAMGIQAKYLNELVVLKNGGTETRSLSISISYPTEAGAQQLLDMLLAYLAEAEPQINASVNAHTCSIVVSSVDERIDTNISNLQNAARTRLETLNASLLSANTQLAELDAPSVSVKKVLLFAVIGAILGAFLVICIACVKHITGNKVYSERTLRNRTGLKILGCVAVPGKKAPADRWLRKLEGRVQDETHTKVVAAAVRNYCADAGKLLIVGSCKTASRELVAQALKEAGVQVHSCGDLLHDTAALAALPECDAVLMVEACGESRYTEIMKTAERVGDQNKRLVGCVLVGG